MNILVVFFYIHICTPYPNDLSLFRFRFRSINSNQNANDYQFFYLCCLCVISIYNYTYMNFDSISLLLLFTLFSYVATIRNRRMIIIITKYQTKSIKAVRQLPSISTIFIFVILSFPLFDLFSRMFFRKHFQLIFKIKWSNTRSPQISSLWNSQWAHKMQNVPQMS